MLEPPPIPEDSRFALSLLARLSEDQRADFVGRLAQAAPTTSTSHFAANVMPVEGLQEEELSVVLEELLAMKTALRPKTDVEEFAKSVAASMSRADVGLIPADQVPGFTEFLIEILGRQINLSITAAAGQLMFESERVFGSAKVLTDLRPVYESGTGSPVAMMPVHLLKISVVNSDQEYTFALDGLDLVQIGREISRARSQEKDLRDFVESARLVWVER
ncbi:hypothetical protein [Longimicrobium sp.]|uniref:hypothetical protein n=1 Tax=Longimicrobium sp. TaxID=2029185 RepID=UPI003B3B7946